MSNQDLNNLTGQDLKLVTKLLYRVSKKVGIIVPKLLELQKYPNGFHQLNSKFNAASKQHKVHLQQVKKAIENKNRIIDVLNDQFRSIGRAKNQNVKKFFDQFSEQIYKMRSQSFKLNCPQQIMHQKKFAIHSFESEYQKLVNPKLKYGQDQLKNKSDQLYKMRNQLIQQLKDSQNINIQKEITNNNINLQNNKNIIASTNKETKTITIDEQGLTAGMKSSVLFSSGFSLILNIKDLQNGDFTKYFLNFGINTGLGVSHTLLANLLKPLGKAGGIVSSLTIGSVVNFSNLVKTGDWSRFGLNSVSTVSAAGLSYGGAQLGMVIGSAIFPGIGTAIGGILGGIGGGLLGGWGASKITNANQPTAYQLQQIKIAQRQHINKIKNDLNSDLKKLGQKVDNNVDFQSLLKNNQIKITQKSIQQIYKQQKSFLTSSMVPFYRQIIRPIVIMAKGLSPTGNVNEGLRILIQMTDKWQ